MERGIEGERKTEKGSGKRLGIGREVGSL